jgi:hypothetical protein
VADTLRVLRVELTGGSESLQKSLKDAATSAGRMGVELGAVQGQLNKITAAGPTSEMKALDLAVRGLGGTSKLTGDQLARVKVEVNQLAAAGARVPASLSGMTGMGSKLGAAFTSFTTGGGVAGALSALGPAGVIAAGAFGAVTIAGTKAITAVAGLADKAEVWSNIAKSTGLGIDTVQQLTQVMTEAQIPPEALKKGMKALSAEIASGGKDIAKFGIDITGWDLLTQEERLQAFARAVMNIEDPALRSAAAQAGLGKTGTDLIPILNDVASGAYKLIGVLGDEQVRALAETDKALDEAGRNWELWKNRALASIVPVFNYLSKPVLISGGEIRGGVAGLAGGFKELERISSPATYLDTSGLTLGPEEEERRKQSAKLETEAQQEAKKAADEMLAVRRKYNELQVAIVKSTEDEAGALRDLDTMSKDILEKGQAIEKDRLDTLKAGRLRGGDMLPSVGGAGLWTRQQDVLDQENENAAAKVKVAAEETRDFGKDLANLAEIMQGFGGTLGAVAAGVIGLAGAFSAFQKLGTVGGKFSLGNLGASLKTSEGRNAAAGAIAAGGGALAGMFGGGNTVAGSTIGGAASGASMGMMVAGPWGALAGAVIGGALGYFKSSKLKKEAKEAGTILGRSVSVEQLKAMKEEAKAAGMDWKEYLKKQKAEEEKAAKVEARQKLEAGLGQAAQSAESLMAKIADGSVKSSAAIEKLFGAVNEALIKYGIGTIDARLTGSKEYSGAAGAAQDVAGMLGGMRQAGIIDTGVSALGAQAAEDLRKQAEDAATAQGLDPQGATRAGLIAIAPILREQLNAAVQSGNALDAKTQELLDEAKANGIEILADPALESLNVQKEQLGVLKQIAGGGKAEPQNANAYNPASSTEGSPDISALPSLAEGGWGDFGRGSLAVLHGREGVFPLDRGGFTGRSGDTFIISPSFNENPLQTFEGLRRQRAFTLRTMQRETARDLANAVAAGRA